MLPNAPAGLTCCTCSGQLYPEHAKRTDEGWRHATAGQCSDRRRSRPCATCGKRSKSRSGQCRTCWLASLPPKPPRNVIRSEIKRARDEDLAWMAETGEGYSGAAKRLGITTAALERWFRMYPAPEVKAKLLANEPVGLREQTRKRREGKVA